MNLSLYNTFDDKSNSEILYCPELDILSYGKDLEDARRMFVFILDSFIGGTYYKKNLYTRLFDFGWKIDKDSRKFIPPSLDNMLKDREGFDQIYNTYKFLENYDIEQLQL